SAAGGLSGAERRVSRRARVAVAVERPDVCLDFAGAVLGGNALHHARSDGLGDGEGKPLPGALRRGRRVRSRGAVVRAVVLWGRSRGRRAPAMTGGSFPFASRKS